MSYAKRTRTCGELRKEHAGEAVTLNGWVDTVRDHGGVLFINLRDRYGKVQLVIDPEGDKDLYETARKAHYEDVVSAKGEVRPRDAAACDLCASTGECPQCHGAGSTDPDTVTPCSVCRGARTCPNCDGTGAEAA